MAKTFRPWEVDQQWLFPPSVRDFVPEGHLAHFIRDTVRDSLDLSAILDAYTEERGFPPYHPIMMTALLLYAYCRGTYSSRKIAVACEERADFMAVTGLQKPDFRTVSEFRRRHLPALASLFVQVVKLCRLAGLAKLGHVALDGTKVNANASKHKAMSYGRMVEAEPELKKQIDAWFAAAEEADEEEDRVHGKERRGDELPSWVADRQKRLEKIREAKAALEAEAREAARKKAAENEDPEPPHRGPGKSPRRRKAEEAKPDPKAQRNFTDPESRIMKSRDGFVQAYNCHAAVDADSQVIVACSLTNAAADANLIAPILEQIKKNTGRQTHELSADAGFCSENDLRAIRRHHVRGYVATGRHKHRQAAPIAQRFPRKGPEATRMRLRLRRGGFRSRYRLRKQTVEPVFGQIKEERGFRRFLLRGAEKVAGEWSLVCLAHNLVKLARAAA